MKHLHIIFLTLLSFCFIHAPLAAAEPLPLPELPDTLRVPGQRADFIIANFWNSLDFSSDPRAADTPFLEQTIADFLSVFPHASAPGIVTAYANLVSRAAVNPKALSILSDLMEIYLASPDSPMLNEQYFATYLSQLLANPSIPQDQLIRPAFLLEDIRKNAPGTKAADFPYVTPDGTVTSLYKTPVSGRLLLIFFDPECEDCHRLIAGLRTFGSVQEKIDRGDLTIMVVYAGDDTDLWLKTKDTFPADWIIGYDRGIIDEKELYNFPSTPTIYTLSPDYTVTGKNLPPQIPALLP